jgi:GTP-binding protein HflX
LEVVISDIYGNVKDLKAHQQKVLKALFHAHNGPVDIVSVPLARKLSQAAFLCHRMVGLLVDRKGEIRFVMVGDIARLYLPDIGRMRGGADRLRGLRLLVARPTPLPMAERRHTLTHDFKTDLEKLRLDAVVEIDGSRDNIDGPVVVAHLGAVVADKKTIAAVITPYRSVHEIKLSFPDLLRGILEDLAVQPVEPRAKSGGEVLEKAILVGVYDISRKEGETSMDELAELARSAKVRVVEKVFQWRQKLLPKTVIGLGKLEEICLRALSLGVEMLIFDQDLSPSQLKNITDLTDLKVLDRTMLILDIFAQRAVTREGKLQVEMAQLTYSLPRLAEKQAGLSRLTGGIGGRGPGETKLEINRRRVKERLARLEDELSKIKMQRELRRKVRRGHHLPTLAIVGYTNAGKSTLLNALSGSDIYAKDELFATLDPHSRRLRFPKSQEVVVTDTVGFINNLPDSLMRAFMATLEELNDADLLIHVVDIANDNFRQQIRVVNEVLEKLQLSKKPTLLVLNKMDKLNVDELFDRKKHLPGVLISAAKGQGLDELLLKASEALSLSLGVTGLKNQENSELSLAEEVVFDERPRNKRRFTKPI